MSKSNEELNALKKEVESVNEKCRELTEEELEQVTGGLARSGQHAVALDLSQLKVLSGGQH